MGDGETPTVAESRALLQAKRTAVEEAGTYVESYSKVKNFQLTADEIQVLASGVMEVEVLEKKRTVVGDGFNFWIKIKARVSTDKMEEMAKRVKEKSVVEDYKRIQEAYDKSQREIEELKRRLAGAKGEKERKQVEAKIADDERLLQANDKYRLGVLYLNKGDSASALKELMEAEKFNNKDPHIANALGLAYYKKGELDLALQRFKRALEFNPKFSEARNNLGIIYLEKKMWDDAIEELRKAAGDILYPTPEYAYTNMGWAYFKKNDPIKAIECYQKAIEKNPRFPNAHHDLGLVYFSLDKVDDAISEYKTAVRYFPNYLDAHYNAGLSFLKLNKKGLAMDAFKEVVRIAPDSDMGRNAQNYIDLLSR